MTEKPVIALFASCLVDAVRPSVGFATARLLERAGFDVVVPAQQTCCGQPGYNAGDRQSALLQAQRVIQVLEPYHRVLVPSGSCAAMLIHHYPRLLEGDQQWTERAQALAAKTSELSQFLAESGAKAPPTETGRKAGGPSGPKKPADRNATIAFHDACSGLRELGVGTQARELLRQRGHSVCELERNTECCGFGGTFCMKYPQISARMADDKLDDALRTGASTLCSGDLGCLLHLEGRARHRGLSLQFRHFVELLDGEQ